MTRVKKSFSFSRVLAVFFKELMQMKRDKLTFIMMAVVPFFQLIMFGYAININPKHLPTTLISQDNSPFVRRYVAGLQNTGYFNIVKVASSKKQADENMQRGDTLFTVTIPSDFTRRLIRGEHPDVLLEADGSQTMAVSAASAAAQQLAGTVVQTLIGQGSLQYLQPASQPFNVITHLKYNPGNNSSFAIVPGLLGVVLVMTMVMITSLSITRESERGTMEGLLATPCRPTEVIIGKITPYLLVGYIQISIILLFAVLLFGLPVRGHVYVLMLCALPFIFSQLALGLMFSTAARNQLQAIQMSFFWFLPNILLSGFMFPFSGMPNWAKWIGEVFPLTHFIAIIRNILFKAASWSVLWQDIWPIILFALVVVVISIKRYRQTIA